MSALLLALALPAHAAVTISPAEATCADGERLVFQVEHEETGTQRRVVKCPSCMSYDDGDIVGLSFFVERLNGDRDRGEVPVTVQCPSDPSIPLVPAVGLFFVGLMTLAGASWASSQIEPA